MDYLSALNAGIVKSGSVIAFREPKTLLDKWIDFWAGPYYHCGIIYIDPETKEVQIYETAYSSGLCRVKFGGGFIPFDIIDTGIDFNSNVKEFADSQIGKSYSWINFGLVFLHLNSPIFGYICSTYVGDILAHANEKFDLVGLTPSALVLGLTEKGCKIVTIDKFAP